MKMYDPDKVEALIDAASTLLGNMYDNGSQGPSKYDVDEENDLPKDEDGDPVWPDVWDLQAALDDIRNKGDKVVVFFTQDEAREQFEIGQACPPVGNENVGDLYDEWFGAYRERDEYPDSDSQFVEWLIEEKGWSVPPLKVEVVVV